MQEFSTLEIDTKLKLKLVNSVVGGMAAGNGGQVLVDSGRSQDGKEGEAAQQVGEAAGEGLFDKAHMEQIKELKTLETGDRQGKHVSKQKQERSQKNINELLPD